MNGVDPVAWIRDHALSTWEAWRADSCPGTWPDYLAQALAKALGRKGGTNV